MIGPAHFFAVALVMAGTSGCTLLDLLLGGTGEGPFNPDESFPFPTAEATFTAGEARLRLAGGSGISQTIVLDELAGEAGVSPDLGTHVSWENEDGWYLGVTSLGADVAFPGGGAYLTIDHIIGGEHFVLVDPTRCVTTIDRSDTQGIRGSATCRGLKWADFFSAYSGTGFPQPVPSFAPFDADITFEAR